MTINLRPEIRAALAGKLGDILARAEVSNGLWHCASLKSVSVAGLQKLTCRFTRNMQIDGQQRRHALCLMSLFKGWTDFASTHDFQESPVFKRPIKQAFTVLKRIFEKERENEQLLLASRWYFDSYCVGLGKLMSNRCAY